MVSKYNGCFLDERKSEEVKIDRARKKYFILSDVQVASWSSTQTPADREKICSTLSPEEMPNAPEDSKAWGAAPARYIMETAALDVEDVSSTIGK